METVIALRPPRHRVERRALALWTVRALGLVLPPVAVLTAVQVLWESARGWAGPALAVVGGAGALYTLAMPAWRYAVHRWEAADDAVYAASGWFVREWRIAPVSRIQTVDTMRGPVEQLLGLATLVVTTASSSGAVRIPGLAPAVAQEAAGRLARITGNTPGDAT
ncbi:PH domain-containing protein [Streptomyces sp. TRM 70351]|uniref:PH domain-containing protein n=1 Tax=Streptomyces sp. TRM 70351 TaxID=3116552 RepID=UPI002E7AE59D|nr:PH domain-containing protein [Streptomyces sp. TRM 70351]MEE1931031.1 PH domain-containing protein [Streptomyces sp. TRM 70351]